MQPKPSGAAAFQTNSPTPTVALLSVRCAVDRRSTQADSSGPTTSTTVRKVRQSYQALPKSYNLRNCTYRQGQRERRERREREREREIDIYIHIHTLQKSKNCCILASPQEHGLASLASISCVSSVGTASSGFASERRKTEEDLC